MNRPRLIDANEVLNIIRNGWSNHYFCKDMCDEINNIPTAYDVDKVVERLEEQLEFNKQFQDSHIALGYRSAYKTAIEIVKGGANNV